MTFFTRAIMFSRALRVPLVRGFATATKTPNKMVIPDQKVAIKFKIDDAKGALMKTLAVFSKYDCNLTRLESRPSQFDSSYNFTATFERGEKQQLAHLVALLDEMKASCLHAEYLESEKVPWFPRHISDLDKFAGKTIDAGAGLEADHPGFKDKEYRARRQELANLALSYSVENPIPLIDYTPSEIATWGAVHRKLFPMLRKHACREYVDQMKVMENDIGYREDNIPQLQHISDYMMAQSGFRLRPVAGLLSARNFLYGLAFKVFFSTQYIRHHSKPLYTPEPDICHELIGHVPLFADKKFAAFSQEIGLASIGASDEQITRLARCYWFSVEFGLCEQDGERKAYGAGLLSSFGELEYSMSPEPEIVAWDPFAAAEQEYPICTYQPKYFLAKSFDDAKAKMQAFSHSFARPFHVRYNSETERMEVDKNLEILPNRDV